MKKNRDSLSLEKKDESTEKQIKKASYDSSFYKAYFSNPGTIRTDMPSRNIVKKLIELIDGAVPNSDIYVNIYDFQDLDLVKALVRADAKGVNVKVLLDSSNTRSFQKNKIVYDTLQASFENSSKPSGVFGFHNDISINHHKHVLLSKTKCGEELLSNVVFSTSSNFTEGQYEVLQDATLIANDEELYNAFLSNWYKMFSLRKQGTKKEFEFARYSSQNERTEAWFLPLIKKGEKMDGHPFLNVLSRASENKIDTIRVGMSLWSSEDEQIEIAERLLNLQEEGSQVEIILRFKESKKFEDALLGVLEEINSKGGEVLFLPSKHVIHSKYMMIKGSKENQDFNWLLNGSTNFTNNAVWGAYDLMTQFEDEGLFHEYEENFQKIQETFSSP